MKKFIAPRRELSEYGTRHSRSFSEALPGVFSLKVLLLLSLLVVVPLQSYAVERIECKKLSNDLLLATSGVWSSDGSLLLVPDIYRETIVRITRDGEVLGGLNKFDRKAGGEKLASPFPSFMHRDYRNERVFVKDEVSGTITMLDNQLNAEVYTNLRRGARELKDGAVVLARLYGWQPMNKGGFVGFVDLELQDSRGPGRHKSAFVYFDDEGISQVFGKKIDTLSELRNHYLRDMPYIATLDGESAYILNMEEAPSIYKVRAGTEALEELSDFPPEFRYSPRLVRNPDWTRARMGAKQATAFYKQMEASSMAAGLYAWNEGLYLAAKEAMTADGTTAWWLIRLNPKDGKEMSRVRLPTQAARISVITGETFAIIEKQAVEGVGQHDAPFMETSSMVLVPAAWLENPARRPSEVSPDFVCAQQ